MGSGQKVIVINQLERAMSTDINRLQAFAASSAIQPWQWLLDGAVNEDESSGIASIGTSVTAPLRAHVLNGLTPRPEIGTVNLFIDPGLILIVSPDVTPNTDYVAAKQIFSDGIVTAGQLTLTPNTSGSTRFDVIECSRDINEIIETSNRDIYDNITGTFNPAPVTKVQADGLLFRIRLGTPSSGFPGSVSGWLPLAVVRVPNTASNWNACDLWDVRPLVSDLVQAPNNVTDSIPTRNRCDAVVDDHNQIASSSNASRTLNGVADITFQNRKVGGRFVALDLMSANVLEPGWAAVNNRVWYLYLLFPFGLPRWNKYTDFSSGSRKPGTVRGIPVFSQKNALDFRGSPSVGVSIPYGFSATTTSGVALIAGMVDNAGIVSNLVCAGKRSYIYAQQFIFWPGNNVPSGTACPFTLSQGRGYPAGAKSVILRIYPFFNGAALQFFTLRVSVFTLDHTGTNLMAECVDTGGITRQTTLLGFSDDPLEVELPIHGQGQADFATAGNSSYKIFFTASASPQTGFDFRYQIVGWRFE